MSELALRGQALPRTLQADNGEQAFFEESVAAEMKRNQALWLPVLHELQNAMAKATFTTWLQGSVLIRTQAKGRDGAGQMWEVSVKNAQAVEWISKRLNQRIIEPMVSAMYECPTEIRYLVASDEAVGETVFSSHSHNA